MLYLDWVVQAHHLVATVSPVRQVEEAVETVEVGVEVAVAGMVQVQVQVPVLQFQYHLHQVLYHHKVLYHHPPMEAEGRGVELDLTLGVVVAIHSLVAAVEVEAEVEAVEVGVTRVDLNTVRLSQPKIRSRTFLIASFIHMVQTIQFTQAHIRLPHA